MADYKEGQIVISKTSGWTDDMTGKEMRRVGDKLRLGLIGTWKSMYRMSATNLRNSAEGYVYPEDIRSQSKIKSKVPKTIKTVAGTAYFVKTEVEDSYGNWNDNYYTSDGYWVIHERPKHHVYKVRGREDHTKHIAGGYFQKGCSQCASFIKKYEKRRQWRGKTSEMRK